MIIALMLLVRKDSAPELNGLLLPLLLVGRGLAPLTCAVPDPGVPVIVTTVTDTEGAAPADMDIEEVERDVDNDDEAREADEEEEGEAPEEPPAASDS